MHALKKYNVDGVIVFVLMQAAILLAVYALTIFGKYFLEISFLCPHSAYWLIATVYWAAVHVRVCACVRACLRARAWSVHAKYLRI